MKTARRRQTLRLLATGLSLLLGQAGAQLANDPEVKLPFSATLDYTDGLTGKSRTLETAVITVTLQAVNTLSTTPDGSVASPGATVKAARGSWVNLSYQVQNTGNVTARLVLYPTLVDAQGIHHSLDDYDWYLQFNSEKNTHRRGETWTPIDDYVDAQQTSEVQLQIFIPGREPADQLDVDLVVLTMPDDVGNSIRPDHPLFDPVIASNPSIDQGNVQRVLVTGEPNDTPRPAMPDGSVEPGAGYAGPIKMMYSEKLNARPGQALSYDVTLQHDGYEPIGGEQLYVRLEPERLRPVNQSVDQCGRTVWDSLRYPTYDTAMDRRGDIRIDIEYPGLPAALGLSRFQICDAIKGMANRKPLQPGEQIKLHVSYILPADRAEYDQYSAGQIKLSLRVTYQGANQTVQQTVKVMANPGLAEVTIEARRCSSAQALSGCPSERRTNTSAVNQGSYAGVYASLPVRPGDVVEYRALGRAASEGAHAPALTISYRKLLRCYRVGALSDAPGQLLFSVPGSADASQRQWTRDVTSLLASIDTTLFGRDMADLSIGLDSDLDGDVDQQDQMAGGAKIQATLQCLTPDPLGDYAPYTVVRDDSIAAQGPDGDRGDLP